MQKVEDDCEFVGIGVCCGGYCIGFFEFDVFVYEEGCIVVVVQDQVGFVEFG